MKASPVRVQMSIAPVPKVLALCITILDTVWSMTDRTKVLRLLCAYYGVTL